MREREMGKNYLLETYLRDLEDPEENGPQVQDLEEGVMRLHQDRNHEIGKPKARLEYVGHSPLSFHFYFQLKNPPVRTTVL